jgi:hypothetical protein
MASPPSTPAAKAAATIFAQVDRIIRERGHGQITVIVRDGKVQLIKVERSYLPENAPE